MPRRIRASLRLVGVAAIAAVSGGTVHVPIAVPAAGA